MIETLLKMDLSTFNELIELSGKADALAVLKPYRKATVPYEIEMARKKLGIVGNGPDVLLSTFIWCQSSVVPSDKVTGEIRERGAVGTSRDCLFSKAPPEFCVFISHYLSDALCELINPEYECVWTHHLTDGDPFCRQVYKRRSEPIEVLDNLGATLVTLPKFNVSKEQYQAANLWALAGSLNAFTSALVDLHGVEKTRAVLGSIGSRIGTETGMKLVAQDPQLKDDIVSMGKLIRGLQNALGQKGSFVVVSRHEVSNEITDCSQQVCSGELCKLYDSLFRGMLSAIDPDYELNYDKMMTHGDRICHWSLRKRERPIQIDEPLKMLKMRFAKGELTKDEYLQMRSLLEG